MEYMKLTIPSPLHLWFIYNFTSSKNTNKCLSWIIYKIARCCYNRVQYELFDITLQLIETEHHDDVIKWKHFPHCRPFVRGIHRSPVNSPHKGQWRGALMFFFDLRLNKRLSKQSWGWWFETLSRPLWRHCDEIQGKITTVTPYLVLTPQQCGVYHQDLGAIWPRYKSIALYMSYIYITRLGLHCFNQFDWSHLFSSICQIKHPV